jgi:hypothetical protein
MGLDFEASNVETTQKMMWILGRSSRISKKVMEKPWENQHQMVDKTMRIPSEMSSSGLRLDFHVKSDAA